MSFQSSTLVQRLWNYCNVLRDDGVSYGDYVEQLTYLLFPKMADEQTRESVRFVPARGKIKPVVRAPRSHGSRKAGSERKSSNQGQERGGA